MGCITLDINFNYYVNMFNTKLSKKKFELFETIIKPYEQITITNETIKNIEMSNRYIYI